MNPPESDANLSALLLIRPVFADELPFPLNQTLEIRTLICQLMLAVFLLGLFCRLVHTGPMYQHATS